MIEKLKGVSGQTVHYDLSSAVQALFLAPCVCGSFYTQVSFEVFPGGWPCDITGLCTQHRALQGRIPVACRWVVSNFVMRDLRTEHSHWLMSVLRVMSNLTKTQPSPLLEHLLCAGAKRCPAGPRPRRNSSSRGQQRTRTATISNNRGSVLWPS